VAPRIVRRRGDLRADRGSPKSTQRDPNPTYIASYLLSSTSWGSHNPGQQGNEANLLFFYKLKARMAMRGGKRRFSGWNLIISQLFSIVSRDIWKSFVFIDIAGWVTNCPKHLRVFNNIAGATFIFLARSLLFEI
jgi:hypothetical protein